MYLKKKKEMPGLTPAAWRKAAAQEMGLDYDTYLALWKANKGAAKAAKMMPSSVPTKPATLSSSPTMGIAKKTVVPKGMSADDAVKALDDIDFKTDKGLLTYDEAHDDIDAIFRKVVGTNSEKMTVFTKGNGIKTKYPPTDFGELVDDIDEFPGGPEDLPGMSLDDIKDAGDGVLDGYVKGEFTATDAADMLDDYMGEAFGQVGASSVVNQLVAIKNKILSPTPVAEQDAIQTAFGPLTHDLAQSVYKKMKKDMPGATPATLRHAAADYLGVDYNDYLKAWKKPTTAAQKAAQTPASKLPPGQNTPLSPATTGKYANKDISVDELKSELAYAYGPKGNKAYISVDYNDLTGEYVTTFPSSILTESGKKAVAEYLKSLGLIVQKKGLKYHIKSPYAVKTAANNAKSIKTSGIYKLPDGTAAWDEASAKKWSKTWWNGLSSAQKQAVKTYTGSGYRDINRYLRGKIRTNPNATAITQLSKAMRPVDHEFTVFRGTAIPISAFKKGALWSDEGFMSTAITPGASWTGLKFKITIPKGTKGAYVDPFSSHVGEKEFIIDKGTKFRILEVDHDNQTVHLIAIPHK